MTRWTIRLALGLMLAVSAAPVAHAQTTAAACAAIDEDASRLTCYDGLFRSPVPTGGTSVAFESEQLIPARPSGRGRARLVVSCANEVLSAQFSFAGQLLSVTGDFAPITIQIDQQSTRTRTLNASPDNTALGFWTTGEANAFLDTLDGGSNMTVRVTPASYRALSVRFNLAGMLEAMAPIRKACE